MSLLLNCNVRATSTDLLCGTYSKLITFKRITYRVNLTFNKQGIVNWVPETSIPGHQSWYMKFEYYSDTLRIYFDLGNFRDSYYFCFRQNDKLTISVMSDFGDNQRSELVGEWYRVNS